jgi:hypothetical protein
MRLQMLLATTMFCLAAMPQARDIQTGTVELTGMGSYSVSSEKNTSATALLVAPEVSVYLTPFLFLGPVISYQHSTYSYSSTGNFPTDYSGSSSNISVGGQIGLLINYSQALFRPLPFFSFSGGGNFTSSRYTGNPRTSEHGPFYDPSVGLKLKISESFLLDVAQVYSYRNTYQAENDFEWSFGFSGII